jgi:cullin 1
MLNSMLAWLCLLQPRVMTTNWCLLTCFRAADRVYSEVKRNARAALLRQIERERDGDMIDRSLLKNILDIFIEVGWLLVVLC